MKRLIEVFCVLIMLVLPASAFAADYDSANFHFDGTLPIVEDWGDMEPLKIVAFAPANCVTPFSDMAQIQRICEETGVKIDWVVLGDSVYAEKVNLMLASGDLPDAFLNVVDSATVSQYIGQDVFIPTTELIEQYCPNLVDIFKRYPEYAGLTVFEDGNRYGFPYIEEMESLTKFPGPIMINTVWLEKVGKEMPTTLEELKDVLIAFRDAGDLNGNGIADEIPLANDFIDDNQFDSYNIFYYLMGCFGKSCSYGASYPFCKVDDDGKIIFVPTNEATRECANFFHELYAENLLDLDGFGGVSHKERMRGDTAIFGVFPCWNPVDDIPVQSTYAQYQPIPRLTGEKGGMGTLLNRSEMQSPCRMLITTKCKYPEIIAALENYIYTPEVSILTNWGALGYNFEKNDQGQLYTPVDENEMVIITDLAKENISMIPETFDDVRVNSTNMGFGLAVLSEYYYNVLEGMVYGGDRLLGQQNACGKQEVISESHDALPPFNLTTEEQTVVAQIEPQLKNIVQAYVVNSVIDGTADANWESFLKELNDAGLATMLEAVQSGYDRYLESAEM